MKAIRQIGALLLMVLLGMAVFWLGRETAPQSLPQSGEGLDPDAVDGAQSVNQSGSVESQSRHLAEQPGAESLRIPDRYALTPYGQVPAAENWQALLAGLTPEEREIAERFAELYPEAYLFTSVEQLRWMVERGYPMPAEIIAAEKMSLDSLLAMDASGNHKAGMLAFDRMVRDLENDTREPDMQNAEWMRDQIQMRLQAQRVRQACSPFSYYQAARANALLFPGDPGTIALVNLIVARDLGDTRLQQTIDHMARTLSVSRETLGLLRVQSGAYTSLLTDYCSRHMTPIPGH